MRVDVRPRHKNSKRDRDGKRCPSFLAWLRGRECMFANTGDCTGRMEAMHLDYAGGKGMGTKVSDRWAVPLCSEHHRRQHREGWDCFDRKYLDGLSAGYAAASYLWRAWPGRIAWERKLEAGNG